MLYNLSLLLLFYINGKILSRYFSSFCLVFLQSKIFSCYDRCLVFGRNLAGCKRVGSVYGPCGIGLDFAFLQKFWSEWIEAQLQWTKSRDRFPIGGLHLQFNSMATWAYFLFLHPLSLFVIYDLVRCPILHSSYHHLPLSWISKYI